MTWRFDALMIGSRSRAIELNFRHDRGPMFWGILTLSFLALLLIIKMLTVLEVRAQDVQYRTNTKKIQDLQEDLDTSRRKYLIAVKAEGVAKHRLSQLKTRFANLKQHFEQIQISTANQEELELTLERVVMEAVQQKLVEMSEDGSLEASGRPKNGQAEGVESEAAG